MIVILLGLLPSSGLKNRLLNFFGADYQIARSAHIQPLLLLGVHRLVMGERSRIGLANVFRDIREVSLGDDAEIGQFNWFTGVARVVAEVDSDSFGTLRLGADAALTSRHYLDCAGGVVLEDRVTVAGLRSTFLTHGVDVMLGHQVLKPVVVARDSMVMTNCLLVPGARIGERIVVASGSTVSGTLDQSEMMYAGAPAKPLKSIAGAAYFSRERGRLIPLEEHERRRKAERDGVERKQRGS